jgi:methionine synthase I (cobalamin-dependent)/5,10-methylenetetrahydrofolate reductase
MTISRNFRERLDQGPILADGAMGTLIHSRGISLDSVFDELNLSRPELVQGIHAEYLAAGAEIVETNTFGANPYRLAAHGMADKAAAINRAGVELARRAIDQAPRGRPRFVAGSVGPLGIQLAPFGRITTEQAYAAFHDQIETLIAAGADLLMVETFSDLYELQEAVRAARDISADIPIVAEATFTRDDRTLLGDTPAQAAEFLAALKVDVIGVNCSNGPAQIARVLKAMHSAAPSLKLSALPNAGWPEYVGGRVMYPAGAEYFADYAVDWRERGISIIGGCCGTTPGHIAAMRIALDDPARVAVALDGGMIVETVEEDRAQERPGELADKLSAGRFVVSVEMSPPKGIATEKVLRAARMLHAAGADVINVSDSPMARLRMSPWAVCSLLQDEEQVETVLHFPTRGRNLLRVQGDLLAAHALGVRNLFVVMGDPTHVGDYPDAADNYDVVPSGLVKLIKGSLNQGQDWAGNKIGQPTNFLVGCALNLAAADFDREVKALRKKLDGADFFITQPVFEIDTVTRFMERYSAEFGPLQAPLLAGLMPLYSARHATFLHNEVPGITIPDPVMKRIVDAGEDAGAEGVKIAQELALRLRDVAGGLYLMPQFGRYDLIAEIIEAVREKARS